MKNILFLSQLVEHQSDTGAISLITADGHFDLPSGVCVGDHMDNHPLILNILQGYNKITFAN